MASALRNSKIFLVDHLTPSFNAKNCNLSDRLYFEGKKDVCIGQVRPVRH
jgi:hypothetical protein